MSTPTPLDSNETFTPRIAAAVVAMAGAGCRGVVKALPATATGSGTGVLKGTSNIVIAAQNGYTPASGDTVLVLAGSTNLPAAKDAGFYVVTATGGASAPYVLTRPSWFQNGALIPAGLAVAIGGEDTLFGKSVFHSDAANTAKVGTDDPLLYPDKVVLKSVALTSGTHAAIQTVPLSANTGTVNAALTVTYGHTPDSGTYGYSVIVTATGAIGTVSVAPIATGAGMAKNASDSASVIDLIFLN